MVNWDRILGDLTNRLRSLVGRGTLHSATDVRDDVVRVQATFDEGDTHDNMAFPQNYGHAALPPAGCAPFAAFRGGDRGAGVVISMGDVVHRPAMEAGDAVTYDNRGQRLQFHQGGADLVVVGKFRIFADNIEHHAAKSILTSVGGYATKLTHVSEGQLVSEIWNEPAIVTPQPDHHYPLPPEEV
ncbi:MAG: phage baseplate assembly protein [Magnetospirillum sp.]|nr:phage baseplate assembly protein [Magnetospirillum sp.]